MTAHRSVIAEPERHRVVVRERSVAPPSDAIDCELNRHIRINPAVLGRLLSGPLSPRADDLIVVASAAAFTDRTACRQTSRGWSRTLHVSVPVLEPSFWRRSDVDRALRGLLGLLTGDSWQFAFTQRRKALETDRTSQLLLRHPEPAAVMPYSDGLDSLAVARLLNADEPSTRLILVTTGGRRVAHAARASLLGRPHTHRLRIRVPVRLHSDTGFREPSFRSRSLLFNVMAAIAAGIAGTTRLIVAESGQGTLGPWLLPVGNEAPDVRTHPLFTSSLEAFFGLILESSVRFEHRRIWTTKGETLKALADAGEASDWPSTHSCARSARQMSLGGHRVHCGVCAACLLRRVSLFASGLGDNAELYMWRDLGVTDFRQMARASGNSTTGNDVDQAFSGVMALNQLALCGTRDLSHEAWTLAHALKRPADAGKIEEDLRKLIATHAREWHAFVDAWGPRSFLTRWTAP